MLLALLVSLSFVALGVCLQHGKGAWLMAPIHTFAGFRQTPADRRRLCRANAAVSFTCAALLPVAAVCRELVDGGRLPKQVMPMIAVVFPAVLVLSIARAAWVLRHHAPASSPCEQAKCDSPQRFSKPKL